MPNCDFWRCNAPADVSLQPIELHTGDFLPDNVGLLCVEHLSEIMAQLALYRRADADESLRAEAMALARPVLSFEGLPADNDYTGYGRPPMPHDPDRGRVRVCRCGHLYDSHPVGGYCHMQQAGRNGLETCLCKEFVER